MWPIDAITGKAPDGHFVRDIIIFQGPRTGGFVAKGFIFEAPDFTSAASSELNTFQEQLSTSVWIRFLVARFSGGAIAAPQSQ